MLLPRLGALLLAVNAVGAFKNTSPFVLLSSEPLPSDAPLQSSQLQLSQDVEDALVETLSNCDQQFYYIFTQDSVSQSDFQHGGFAKLQRRITKAEKKTVVEIPEVGAKGGLSAEKVKSRLGEVCRKSSKKEVNSWPSGQGEYQIVTMSLPELPTDPKSRASAVRNTDDALDDTVASVLGKTNSAVLIYITTPASSKAVGQDGHAYEMDEPYSALHTDLKRDLEMHEQQSNEDNPQAGLPLFEQYQFLTPGLFMGIGVSLLLLSILYVGLNAISGLEVSYAAFSKEMGPQAQKGKQQ